MPSSIHRQKENLNIKGAFWHVLQTLVGSLIIIVSALVIRFTGFLAIDPLLGMAFGIVLFWASWRIIRESLDILLESTPKDLDLNAAIRAVEQVEGVERAHHVHAWSLTQGKDIFSAHVKVDAFAGPDRVLCEVHDLLREKFRVYFSTVQVERRCLDEGEAADIDITRDAA